MLIPNALKVMKRATGVVPPSSHNEVATGTDGTARTSYANWAGGCAARYRRSDLRIRVDGVAGGGTVEFDGGRAGKSDTSERNRRTDATEGRRETR